MGRVSATITSSTANVSAASNRNPPSFSASIVSGTPLRNGMEPSRCFHAASFAHQK